MFELPSLPAAATFKIPEAYAESKAALSAVEEAPPPKLILITVAPAFLHWLTASIRSEPYAQLPESLNTFTICKPSLPDGLTPTTPWLLLPIAAIVPATCVP